MEDESNAMMEQTSRCKDSVVNSRSQMLSVIRPYGYSITKCGYCKGSRSNLIKEPESASVQSKVNPPSLTPHSTKSSASTLSLASKSYSVLADTVSPTLYEELIHMGCNLECTGDKPVPNMKLMWWTLLFPLHKLIGSSPSFFQVSPSFLLLS